MKRIVLALLATCSFSSVASPYVAIEYGIGSSDHDVEPVLDGKQLNPELDEGIMGVTLGYALSDQWALELGYSQFDLDVGSSQRLPNQTIDGKDYMVEKEWDASISAKQLSIAPVYTYHLNNLWRAKFKAGLTYTQYEESSHVGEEYEWVLNDDVEFDKALGGYSKTSNELGALVGVGVEYQLLRQVTIGANVKYQLDAYSNTASANLSASYYF
uniref:AcfA family outer membrane beta-barrel protein n=1 Tax=Thaumasiovibrio occultus TaxID=1891184 RepID=UPI000B362F57|nr:AcfA family outer membrane beta-barrel protein [Thaumasiovibrio occultus]